MHKIHKNKAKKAKKAHSVKFRYMALMCWQSVASAMGLQVLICIMIFYIHLLYEVSRFDMYNKTVLERDILKASMFDIFCICHNIERE